MNVAPLDPPPRVAFLGDPRLALHFPSQARWCASRVFALEPGRCAEAVQEALRFAPDVSIVAGPLEVPEGELARLPGVKIGMVPGPLPSDGPSRLAGRTRAAAGDGGFDFFTWFEEPPAQAAHLPILQVLPLPIDAARCLPAPRFEERRVIVAEWARPPPACLARLREAAEVAEIPLERERVSWPELLAQGGVLAYWSREPLGRLDPLPLAALANGLLVVANASFPESWGIEAEDEYLPRPGAEQLARAVEDSLRFPDAARPVRARAWQKAREAFSADGAFHRLVHDARLFGRAAVSTQRTEPPGPR